MNWLDYILIFVLIYYLYNGLRQGLVKQVAGLIGLFVAFICSLRWSGVLRSYLDRFLKLDEVFVFLGQESEASLWLVNVIINIITFLMVLMIISMVLSALIQRLRVINKIPIVGPINAVSGAVVGAMKGLLVIFIAVAVISLLETNFWQDSMQASAVVDLSAHYMGLLFHFIARMVVDNLILYM